MDCLTIEMTGSFHLEKIFFGNSITRIKNALVTYFVGWAPLVPLISIFVKGRSFSTLKYFHFASKDSHEVSRLSSLNNPDLNWLSSKSFIQLNSPCKI